MKYLKTYESIYNFKVGDRVWSTAFEKFYTINSITDCCLVIEDEDGNLGEFLKKGFIPEIEYNLNKYNL